MPDRPHLHLVNGDAPPDSDPPVTALERLLQADGAAHVLSNAQLVELLAGEPNGPSPAALLSDLGGVRGLLGADLLALMGAGVSAEPAARVLAAAELLRRAHRSPQVGLVIQSAADVHRLLVPTLGLLDHERLVVVCLDARNRVICARLASVGTAQATIVDPATVFRLALRAGAAAVVVAHNHPSGDASPSIQDAEVTTVLMQAGLLLRVPVLDHVVIAGPTWTSMAETVTGERRYPVRVTTCP